jgi:hypothetical protein
MSMVPFCSRFRTRSHYSCSDPLTVPAGAYGGSWIGGGIGYIIGSIGDFVVDAYDTLVYGKPPANAWDPDGPKAPGYPGGQPGYTDPKGGPNWVPNPNGSGNGWESGDGTVWVPTGQGGAAHGGPHWDVQNPDGNYDNVYPGGKVRPGQ